MKKTKTAKAAKPNGATDPLTAFGAQDGSARAKVLKAPFANLNKPVPLAKLDNASLRILERKIAGDLTLRGGAKVPFKIERDETKETVTLKRR